MKISTIALSALIAVATGAAAQTKTSVKPAKETKKFKPEPAQSTYAVQKEDLKPLYTEKKKRKGCSKCGRG